MERKRQVVEVEEGEEEGGKWIVKLEGEEEGR